MVIKYVLQAAYSGLHVAMYESRKPYPSISWNRMRWPIPPNAPLESEYAVYMLYLQSLVSSYIVMCVERLAYMFFVGSEPVRGVAKICLGLRRLGSNGVEDRRPNLENAVHEGDWAVVCRVVRVRFVGLVY